MTKTIALLGATGSIGRQTLEVAGELGLRVAALTANTQVDLLEQQARQYMPRLAVLYDENAALALKNSLGLVCDPVAGLVEVPCVKRNGIYAVLAIAAADLALAGIESFVPLDQVIDAMYQIGCGMPACVRETGEGGLAVTPAGIAAKRRLF